MDVRVASPDDVDAVCEFGAMHIPRHYGPLLGPEAARAQVDKWWTVDRISKAAVDGRIVVAETEGAVIGVGEWSLYEGTPVIWKLYVDPSHRGKGIGPRLIDAIVGELPVGVDRLRVEHFAVNRRASSFYEREGFSEIRNVEHPTDPALNVVWRELSLRG